MDDERNDGQLVVRIPSTLLGRLDAYAERLAAEMPGARWSRANVARMLLTKALDLVEGETPKKSKR